MEKINKVIRHIIKYRYPYSILILLVYSLISLPDRTQYSENNYVYVKAFDSVFKITSANLALYIIVPISLYLFGFIYDMTKKGNNLVGLKVGVTLFFMCLWLFFIQLTTEFHKPMLILIATAVSTFFIKPGKTEDKKE